MMDDEMGINKIFEMLVQDELNKSIQQLFALILLEILSKIFSEITEPVERLLLVQEAAEYVKAKVSVDEPLDDNVLDIIGTAKNTILDICSNLDEEN